MLYNIVNCVSITVDDVTTYQLYLFAFSMITKSNIRTKPLFETLHISMRALFRLFLYLSIGTLSIAPFRLEMQICIEGSEIQTNRIALPLNKIINAITGLLMSINEEVPQYLQAFHPILSLCVYYYQSDLWHSVSRSVKLQPQQQIREFFFLQ